MIGFPVPDNRKLATDVENIVRNNGAIPATIGIFNGVATVGQSIRLIFHFLILIRLSS